MLNVVGAIISGESLKRHHLTVFLKINPIIPSYLGLSNRYSKELE